LTQEEIRGVIGHELGHIKHKDFLVMTVLSALPLLAFLITRLTFRVALTTGGGSSRKKGGEIASRILLLVAAAISYIVYIVTLYAS